MQASVVNRTGQPIPVFEVDYPSASFGGSALAPGATFYSRFKVLGTGPTRLLWTDAAQHEHTSPGPTLEEGQEGTLTITLNENAANWTPNLHPAH